MRPSLSRELRLYLEDILSAVRKIEAATEGHSAASLSNDALMTDAVLFNLIVIGEAAAKVPPELRAR